MLLLLVAQIGLSTTSWQPRLPPTFIFPSHSCLQASSLMEGQPLLDHQSPLLGSCHQYYLCLRTASLVLPSVQPMYLRIACSVLCPAGNKPLMSSGVLNMRLLHLIWRQQHPLPHVAVCSRHLHNMVWSLILNHKLLTNCQVPGLGSINPC